MFRISIFVALAISISQTAQGQPDSTSALADIRKFQVELNDEYRSKDKSPLEPGDLKKFKAHEFFPIDLKYRVTAKLKRTENAAFFQMATTRPRINMERIFGMVTFSIEGKEFEVPVYQSQKLMQQDEYRDYLFFPFTDITNGTETYDGGRYIDLRIPQGDEIVIDFNKAYNPYCAYSPKFSCPIVPAKNHLDIRILAGIKYTKK